MAVLFQKKFSKNSQSRKKFCPRSQKPNVPWGFPSQFSLHPDIKKQKTASSNSILNPQEAAAQKMKYL